MFIVLLITVRGLTATEKEIISNGMEGFWGYLKRKLDSKGGITRARLPLYIAEYVWRYNHRTDPESVKIRRIL